jgi:hypothetical protein
MTPLLFALHQIASRRGDGLRTELLKRSLGQNAGLLAVLRVDRADGNADIAARKIVEQLPERKSPLAGTIR